ncbi:MAG: PadR family transcriptional regulator [Hellea sp.]|nr:PadR family transcriptional regulator [Hellea sp.]
MALAEAILVCLTDRPMSGYDLAKNFDASIGFFWRASHQQIYRELGKLRDKGLVESREISQSGKPNRIVHTITKDGKKALNLWSRKPNRMPSFKDELMAKFYALEYMDIDALKDQLTVRIDQHKSKLSQYHKIKERFYDGKKLNRNQIGKLFVLEMGIESEQTSIHNLNTLMEKLSDL